MTRRELYAVLTKCGIPAAYGAFGNSPPPPYIIFERYGSESICADNRTIRLYDEYRVELYTDKRNEELEEKLEELFDNAEIEYEISESYVSDERLFQTVYEIII